MHGEKAARTTGARKNKAKQQLKKISNRKIRQYNKEISVGGNYKRVFDLAWNLT